MSYEEWAAAVQVNVLGLELANYADILINDLIPGVTKSNMSPGGQDPADVYPFLKQLSEGGQSGLAWFKGEPVNIWASNPTSARRSILQRIKRKLLG